MHTFKITATSTRANSAKKEDIYVIRTISQEEAVKAAHTHFSSGSWSRQDYKITDIKISL